MSSPPSRRRPSRTGAGVRVPQARRTGARIRPSRPEGFLPGCVVDRPSVHEDWSLVQDAIDGVRVQEVRNVLRERGLLTEIYREDWGLDGGKVAQVFQVVLPPGAISAWHVHFVTLDRLFVNDGAMRLVLYDARASSPSCGRVNEYRLGIHRPALVTVPPGVWHGLQNLGAGPSRVLNLADRAYAYRGPDHWRLPPATRRIPYRFPRLDAGR